MNFKKSSLLIFVFIIILSGLPGCSKTVDLEEMPVDFDFRLSYGTYGKQKIDTFNDTVVKDLVEDGTVEANITLTEQEMEQIYKQMMSIDIMESVVEIDEKECDVTPSSFTKWDIQMNGKTTSFYTKNYCDDYPEYTLKLLKLADFIHNIIINKEEYKELPESKGYYE
ncbi:hypothetical protein [Paenisporosarcina sp. TG20]|uniref:hypothetical protein n=1 Tax=Paenisporosarcina sp. TG20 TaxID=1211706 RepID=UPI0003087327|nr:hypothetical protein [Paenisporosarcina sp. TG20]